MSPKLFLDLKNTSVDMASGSSESIRNDLNYNCHRCTEKFDTKKSFEDHMKTHDGKYKCDKCKRVYFTREEKREHMKNGYCSKK